jgi:truncated hemoglobin YjbI
MDCLSKSVGGDDVVDAAMEEFAWHISEDKGLREILEGYDVEQIKDHQRRFFRLALTGFPDSVNVQKYLRGKHAHLFARGLSVRHFDTLAGRFLDTLQSLRVETDILEKANEFLRVAREAFDSQETDVDDGDKASWRTTSWLNASEL